jgi:sugar lactone lactonase YvrE
MLPDTLRWLWRDYPQPVKAGKGGVGAVRHYITEFLDPAHDWELVGEGYKSTEGPAVDREGNVYFCAAGSKIYKIGPDGKAVLFKENTGETMGLMFGPDKRLYAVENGRKRVVAYGGTGSPQVISQGVEPNDLAVSSKGAIYFTSAAEQRVYYVDPKGARRVVFDGRKDGNLLFPNGVRMAPDESLLAVADTSGRTVWSFQIQSDGGLANGEPFYHLQLPDDVAQGPVRSAADGMTFDETGHLYVATNLGIQILDQPGRVVGIIRKPGAEEVTNVVFGGPGLSTLYATAGDKVWRRAVRRKGVLPWQPVKLPRPQL